MEDMTKTQHYNSERCHTWSYVLSLVHPLSHVKEYEKNMNRRSLSFLRACCCIYFPSPTHAHN